MDRATCPLCETDVIVTPDGRCPSCDSLLDRQRQLPYTQPAATSPEAEPQNPYQAPQVVTVADAHGKSVGAPDPTLLWILCSITGRIPRRIFWGASIGTTVVFYSALFGLLSLFGEESDALNASVMLLYVPMMWVSVVNSVKRWHDRAKSGWWILIGFVPLIGPIWQFVETGCLRGTVGPNRFGPDPT